MGHCCRVGRMHPSLRCGAGNTRGGLSLLSPRILQCRPPQGSSSQPLRAPGERGDLAWAAPHPVLPSGPLWGRQRPRRPPCPLCPPPPPPARWGAPSLARAVPLLLACGPRPLSCAALSTPAGAPCPCGKAGSDAVFCPHPHGLPCSLSPTAVAVPAAEVACGPCPMPHLPSSVALRPRAPSPELALEPSCAVSAPPGSRPAAAV